ncbi:hypothetical protein MA20_45275 [Bradyrhizobium japonicum]|uniref:Uncharacterized protein n=1 Tax=Bradyrhizobium japonicum TaxID=375 RepID=A0A0A3XG37_BRAJP|nr:hypothetical protein [Bradyrhizobium japonicum]KGT73275.1 hypothetical protein MA20_45275 [Bradyrhizobium japonicum]
MVKAAPAVKAAKLDLLFEFVVAPLNAPAQLGGVDQLTNSMFAGSVESQYLPDQQPFLWPGLGEPAISLCWADAHTGQSRG